MEIVVRSLKGSDKLTGLDSQLSINEFLDLIHRRTTLAGPSVVAAHYLVHKERTLDDGTLSSAGLVDGDTVVLLRRPNVQMPEPLDDGPAPDASTIREAIKEEAQRRGLDPSTQEDEPPPRASRRGLLGLPRDLQDTDARLLQLISALGGHLHVMRDAPAEVEPERSDEPASPVGEVTAPEPPAEALQQLVDMGFSEAVVRKALLLNRNQVEYATEWLLQHSEDPDAAEPVSQEQIRRIYGPPPRSRMVAASRSSTTRQRMIGQLVEMGFGPEDAGQALDSFHTLDVALQWLLNRQAQHQAPSQGSAPPPTPSSEPSTPSAAQAAAQQQQQQAAATASDSQGFQESGLPSGPAATTAEAGTAGGNNTNQQPAVQQRGPSPLSRVQGPAADTDAHTQEADHDIEDDNDAGSRDDEDEDEEEDDEDEDHEEEEEEDDDDEEMGDEVFLPAFMSVSPADMEQLMQGMSEMYGSAPFLTGDMEGTEMLMRIGPADAAQLMSEMLQAGAAAQAAEAQREGLERQRAQEGEQEEEEEGPADAPARV